MQTAHIHRPEMPVLYRVVRACTLVVTCMLAMSGLSGCGAAAPPARAVLVEPAQQAALRIGVSVNIVGQVTGAQVKAVDVYVDGVKYATIDMPTAENQFDVLVPWTPQLPGTHVIQLKGVNDKGEQVIASDLVFVVAQAPESTAPPPPTPTSPPPISAAPTPETPLVTPSPTPLPNLIKVTNDFVNVRAGPGTNYERVGQLTLNQIAKVIGKNADGTWWQIEFQDAQGGTAWVIGQYVEFSGDAGSVPVVPVSPAGGDNRAAAPTAPPAPTPTSELPPSALLPYSQNMRFSPRDDIGDVPLGHDGPKSSTLVWEVNGAKKLELEIVVKPGPGTYSACPAGDLNSVRAAGFTPGQRVPLSVPSGSFPFTIEGNGYYEFIIHVVKADNSTTFIPRAVIVGCYKQS